MAALTLVLIKHIGPTNDMAPHIITDFGNTEPQALWNYELLISK